MCFSVLSVVITFRQKVFLNLVIHVFDALHTVCPGCDGCLFEAAGTVVLPMIGIAFKTIW